MNSRTPMGVQPPRPPQRALSASSLSAQRLSPQQRSLSQQYTPSSPARKDSSSAAADSVESADTQQNRPGIGTPRRVGSRLRLELSNDGGTGAPVPVESPQSLSSARALTLADGLESVHSPAPSRTSHQDTDNPPLPMPKRRPPPSQTLFVGREPTNAAPPPKKEKESRPKPYTVEIPSTAPRLASSARHENVSGEFFGQGLFSGHADFYPWTGKHLEDQWSTESITKGTWEKQSSTELSSARLAIFPAFKQKPGLSALSTIFMGVLSQRRIRGQVSAPSSFKPPPRVTLTDSKREGWLKDLANPSTSLRRLSRTIPHGIRGRTLLDQCLNKNVPTERAVWLAKCVGANEIRAFKRKGVNGTFVMGGELKWSREWTVLVEQFVDSIVSAVNESDWKSKVTYAIRLATNLYAESLLDRDHYLDWVTAGLETSPQGKLPMWILIARIYWADLLHSRKYGRRLVFALLSHMGTIHGDPDRDIFTQLSSQLSMLLTTLAKDNPESFISPNTWPTYRDVLKSSIPADDEAAHRAYSNIDMRNSRLLGSNYGYAPAGRQQLVKLLDSTFRSPLSHDLSTKCWNTSNDKKAIVRTTVEWATSIHRPGLAKVYVAVSLLKIWQRAPGFEATMPILETLDGVPITDQARKSLVYRLVSELVRAEIFSVPQYLRWLIARGGCHGGQDTDAEKAHCATRLLVELPVHCFQEKWITERANLLRRSGSYSISDESVDTTVALKYVDHALGLPLPANDPIAQKKPLPLRKLSKRLCYSNNALRSTVAAHLLDIIVHQVPNEPNASLTMALFSSVRTILENIGDFSMLLAVIESCTTCSDPELLGACGDTINANLPVFLAMEPGMDLVNVLLGRLKVISQQQGLINRPLLAALANLARRLPGREGLALELRQELLSNDRSNAIDACSPVSDNMLPQSQNNDGEFSEEIDKLLASGNRIDHPTMNRLFRTIVPKLEADWSKMDDCRRVFASSLTKMRVFDPNHFDKLMADWVSHVRTLQSRPLLADMFPLLLSVGCLTVSTLIRTANSVPPSQSDVKLDQNSLHHSSAVYFQELLQLILVRLPKSSLLTPDEKYQFSIYQQSAVSEDLNAFLALIRNAVLEYGNIRGKNSEISLPLEDPSVQQELLESLKNLVVVESVSVSEALSLKSLPTEARDLVNGLTTKMLIPGEDGSTQTSFDQILQLANELTLPFCQLKLNFDLLISESNAGTTEDHTASQFELFANAMDRALDAGNIMWTSMLPCLSSDISQHLKTLAQGRLLGIMPSLKSTQRSKAVSDGQVRMAENLLGVIEAITAGQPSQQAAHVTATLVQKLSDILEIVATKDDENRALRSYVLSKWLPIMIRLLALHNTPPEPLSALTPTNQANNNRPSALVNHEPRARLLYLLCGLFIELQSVPRQETGTLWQQIFDLALIIVDSLPEEPRIQCAKHILLLPGTTACTSLSSDRRLYYLLSTPPPTPADNLVLSHKDKPATPQPPGRSISVMWGLTPAGQERLTPFVFRRWEMLSESTPNVGENDTSLSLGLFESIKIQ